MQTNVAHTHLSIGWEEAVAAIVERLDRLRDPPAIEGQAEPATDSADADNAADTPPPT